MNTAHKASKIARRERRLNALIEDKLCEIQRYDTNNEPKLVALAEDQLSMLERKLHAHLRALRS